MNPEMNLGVLRLFPGAKAGIFTLYHNDLQAPVQVQGPSFEIDGQQRNGFQYTGPGEVRELAFGGRETTIKYADGNLSLVIVIRSFSRSPILRFQYRLKAGAGEVFTKKTSSISLQYFSVQRTGLQNANLSEYQLSHFDPVQHSYLPNCVERSPANVLPGLRFVGPVGLFHCGESTLLAAYEHGADHPGSFLDFSVESRQDDRGLVLQERHNNVFNGQAVDGWQSVWFELGLNPGGREEFLKEYRRFFLEEVCENRESRKPNIYYNTWNYQERQKYFKGRPYTESMNAERMLAEIDVAHKLGIDVFVVDTGWYKKTGDWLPNLEKFPEGLKELKRRLDQYGMKLGLWFNPTVSALTSQVFKEHPEWEMTWEGKPSWRGPIWETEESTGMCLASDYADYYVDVMVRLNNELGVSYFKWDAVQQYGCDSPLHNHGTQANSAEERREGYAFQMGLAMIRIVEEVTRRCPGVIVDFDITEGGRFVGLGFLSVGKYFLVNNGPYFHDFDIPRWVKMDPDTINVFFYPGPARPRICRTGARYDELIPSILFLTHYLPDGPQLSQRNTIASLVLGGNGFWGDLPALSAEDIQYLGEQTALYKRVADGLTHAYPYRQGFAGASPEIWEKISPDSCSGAVIFFTVAPGKISYYTQPLNLDALGEVVGADEWAVVEGGRLKISIDLEKDDARVVYIIPVGR